MSKRVWRRRSALGRIVRECGAASVRPPNSPPTMRMPAAGGRCRLGRRRRRRANWRLEIGAGGPRQLRAKLVAENSPANLTHLALGQIAELERPIGDTDQPIGIEAEVAEQLLDLAILALAQGHGQPDIRPLDA